MASSRSKIFLNKLQTSYTQVTNKLRKSYEQVTKQLQQVTAQTRIYILIIVIFGYLGYVEILIRGIFGYVVYALMPRVRIRFSIYF